MMVLLVLFILRTHVPYLFHPAVAYSLEADADLRKKNLVPRATFTESSASDNAYESKGTISLNSQGTKQCVTRKLAIQVLTPV